MPDETLTRLDRDIWEASRPLPLFVGDIGTRMTVIRLHDTDGGDGLMVHSPVPLDQATRDALDRIGKVRWIVGPSMVHHFYLGDYVKAYPEAQLLGAPGLASKRHDLSFDMELGNGPTLPWGDELEQCLVEGAPMMNEVVFFHPASRTLVLTDLAFNVKSETRRGAGLFHWLVGSTDRFGPHRLIRLGIRDRRAAAKSLEQIMTWDFDRVTVTHGDILENGGKEAMKEAFAFLLEN